MTIQDISPWIRRALNVSHGNALDGWKTMAAVDVEVQKWMVKRVGEDIYRMDED